MQTSSFSFSIWSAVIDLIASFRSYYDFINYRAIRRRKRMKIYKRLITKTLMAF